MYMPLLTELHHFYRTDTINMPPVTGLPTRRPRRGFFKYPLKIELDGELQLPLGEEGARQVEGGRERRERERPVWVDGEVGAVGRAEAPEVAGVDRRHVRAVEDVEALDDEPEARALAR